MTIAERVRANQDIKEMTRRSIQILAQRGGYTADLEKEFFQTYHEKVWETS